MEEHQWRGKKDSHAMLTMILDALSDGTRDNDTDKLLMLLILSGEKRYQTYF